MIAGWSLRAEDEEDAEHDHQKGPEARDDMLLCSRADFLNVNRLLRRIKLADHYHMRGGEISDGLRIIDDPDGAIIITYKDGSLWFPFRVAYRSASTPAFLNAIRAAGLGVIGSTTFITDPTGSRRACSGRACSRRVLLLRQH